MAMLHELVKPGIRSNIKRLNQRYLWDGNDLSFHESVICAHHVDVLFQSDWQLDEPTVEDVLRERGFEICDATDGQFWLGTEDELFLILLQQRPTTAAETTRIIDFLESLNK